MTDRAEPEPPAVGPHDGVMIRAERPGDEQAIAQTVEAAFESPTEARLVDAIRASAGFVPELSLVAELEARIVGHVMISAALLNDAGVHLHIVNLSPLAVAPEVQGRGIGSALVREVTARADQRTLHPRRGDLPACLRRGQRALN